MDLKTYRTTFLLMTLALSLVASFPLLNSIFTSDSTADNFSSIFLLGPDHLAENYPFTVTTNETYSIFLDVENQMGNSESYMVRTKIRNPSQSVSELSNSQPSSLKSIHDFYFSVSDQQIWETKISFKFNDVSFMNNVANLQTIVLNDDVLPIGLSIPMDSEDNSFYFQLFCELYRYDMNLRDFIFTGQYVGIWLNLTQSQQALV